VQDVGRSSFSARIAITVTVIAAWSAGRALGGEACAKLALATNALQKAVSIIATTSALIEVNGA